MPSRSRWLLLLAAFLPMSRHFVVQILSAMMVMEDASIIHCDLKPENILLVGPPGASQGAKIKATDGAKQNQVRLSLSFSEIQSMEWVGWRRGQRSKGAVMHKGSGGAGFAVPCLGLSIFSFYCGRMAYLAYAFLADNRSR